MSGGVEEGLGGALIWVGSRGLRSKHPCLCCDRTPRFLVTIKGLGFLRKEEYSLLVAAVTNHHKVGGLKQQKFILSGFWRLEI